MGSNILQKSTNYCIATNVFACVSSFNNFMDSKHFWSCGSIFDKSRLNFSNQTFFYFRSGTIEKQGIINLRSYSRKRDAFVFLRDSEGGFHWKKMRSIVHFSISFLYKALSNRRSMSSNTIIFYISEGISSSLSAFLVLFFFGTSSSTFSQKCPSLM